MSFYEFRQNNSGGSWQAPAIQLYVEADTPFDANRIAQEEGVYFDGCATGEDCGCCGDRWYPVQASDALPMVPEDDTSSFGGMYEAWARKAGIPVRHVIYQQQRQIGQH